MYRVTYDGSINDESDDGYVATGGQAEAIGNVLKADHRKDLSLNDALVLGVKALGSVGGEGGGPRQLVATGLEVAILDRARSGRTFRRITGNALAALLPAKAPEA
jgi:proteasome alpha subunit